MGLLKRLSPLVLVTAACGVDGTGEPSGDSAYMEPGAERGSWPEGDRTTFASSLDVPAQGFALGVGRATVAMNEMTCGVHLESGSVFYDVDLRPGRIQDGTDDVDVELTALMVAPPLVHFVPVGNPYSGETFLVRGVRQARMVGDDGFVALRQAQDGTCEIRSYAAGELVRTVPVPDTFDCHGDLDMALAGGGSTGWIAGPSGVWALGTDAVTPLGLDGDTIAWDAAHAVLYVGTRGGDVVHAVDGAETLWTLDLQGELVSLDDGGDQGGLVVAQEAGLGASVTRLDAGGSTIDALVFEEPVIDIEVSPLGDTLAVSRLDDHAYYWLQD